MPKIKAKTCANFDIKSETECYFSGQGDRRKLG
jgi:hypothetical protein